jgi:hypothetical protein
MMAAQILRAAPSVLSSLLHHSMRDFHAWVELWFSVEAGMIQEDSTSSVDKRQVPSRVPPCSFARTDQYLAPHTLFSQYYGKTAWTENLTQKNYSHTLDSLVSTDVIQGHVTSSASISSTGRSIGCISTSFRLYTFRAFGFVLTVPVFYAEQQHE